MPNISVEMFASEADADGPESQARRVAMTRHWKDGRGVVVGVGGDSVDAGVNGQAASWHDDDKDDDDDDDDQSRRLWRRHRHWQRRRQRRSCRLTAIKLALLSILAIVSCISTLRFCLSGSLWEAMTTTVASRSGAARIRVVVDAAAISAAAHRRSPDPSMVSAAAGAIDGRAQGGGRRRKRGLAESSLSSSSSSSSPLSPASSSGGEGSKVVGGASGPGPSLVFGPGSSGLDYYDNLRRSPEARFAGGVAKSQLVRVPDASLSLSSSSSSSSGPTDAIDQTLDILHLSIFIDLNLRVKSDGDGDEDEDEGEDGGLDLRGWSSAFSVIMAVHHWNNNMSDIAPVVAEARKNQCPNLRLTAEFFNTAFSPIVAARKMVQEIFPRLRHGGLEDARGDAALATVSAPAAATTTTTTTTGSVQTDGSVDEEAAAAAAAAASSMALSPPSPSPSLPSSSSSSSSRPPPPDPSTDYPVPIAIIGSNTSIESATLAALSSTIPLPQVAFAATAPGLDNRDEYPYFGRVVPNSRGDALAAVDYFVRVLGATHVAILHVRDEYGSQYASAFRQAGLGSNPQLRVTTTASFSQGTGTPDPEDVRVAVSSLRLTKCRYFFGVLFPKHMQVVMSEATRQGIVGDEYLWLFGDALMGDTTTEVVPKDSVLATAMKGIGILHIAPIVTSDHDDDDDGEGVAGPDGQGGGPMQFLRHRDQWIQSEEVKAYFRGKVYEHEDERKSDRRLGRFESEASNGKTRPKTKREMGENGPSDGTAQKRPIGGNGSPELAKEENNADSEGNEGGRKPTSRLLIDLWDGVNRSVAPFDCVDDLGNYVTARLNGTLSDGALDVPSVYNLSDCNAGDGSSSSSSSSLNTGVDPDRYFAFDLTLTSRSTNVALALTCEADISAALSLRIYEKGNGKRELPCIDRIESTCDSTAVAVVPTGEYVFLLHGGGGDDTERAGFDMRFDCADDDDDDDDDDDAQKTPPVATKHASLYDGLMYDAVISVALAICTSSEMGRLFDPRFIYETFAQNTSFYGATSYVDINNVTGSREFHTVSYAISNLVVDTVNATSNTTSFLAFIASRYSILDAGATTGQWQIIRKFVYHDGTTIPPENLPKVDVAILSLSTGAKVFGLILCGLLLMMTIGFSTWTVIHRRTAVVRASQPFFLHIVCCGSFLMALAIIPMSFTYAESTSQLGLDVACMLAPWFFELGFVTVFSALFSKLLRVNKLFQDASRFTRVTVQIRDVMIPFATLLVLTVSVLISWTIVAPLKYKRLDTSSTDEFGRIVAVVDICAPDPESKNAALAFALTLAAIDGIVLFFANHQAYKARSIAVEYSESRFIAIAMKIMTEGFLIGVPVLVTVPSEPSPQFITRSAMVAVVCLAVMLSTFVPKLIYLKIWFKEQKEREERRKERTRRREEFEARVISSTMGSNVAFSTTVTNVAHSTVGSNLVDSATGSILVNSATGSILVNSATGSNLANSATGSNLANSATGSNHPNSTAASNLAN